MRRTSASALRTRSRTDACVCGNSTLARDRDLRRPEHVFADEIAGFHDTRDRAGRRGVRGSHGRHGFVPCVIKSLAGLRNTTQPKPFQRGQELLPDARHSLDERILRASGRGVERAVEIVEHLEETDDERATAAFDVLREFLAQPGARLVELLRRAAVLRQQLLQLGILRFDPGLELLDVRGLEPRLFSGRRGLALRPPSPIVHLDRHCTDSRGGGASVRDSYSNVRPAAPAPMVTVPPFSSLPNRISSVSLSRTSRWTTRARGRAP